MVNEWIWTDDGQFVGEADLLDPASGFVAEYDGWVHRRRDQRDHDRGRDRSFADVGLTVRRYIDQDLAGHPAALHASLRSGHAAALTVVRRRWTLMPS
jgi:very-short-patch-repair endonuclease